MGHTGHGQIHADLGALAVEVHAQALDDLLRRALGHADHMLSRPGLLTSLLLELLPGRLALRAELRSGLPLVNIATNGADKLFHNRYLQKHFIFANENCY